MRIEVRGGRGGNGCVSFRREKFVPRGGPDGGRGGRGGSVLLVARENLAGFVHLGGRRVFAALDGEPGRGSGCDGAFAEDLVIFVPPGTVAHDVDSGEILGEVVSGGEAILVAQGGRGGMGNRDLASARRRAPKIAQRGEEGRSRNLFLEVRLFADAGLVGLPNAGKSSLLARVSAARPKIAEYPFTTTSPVLGLCRHDDVSFVLADLPGLIEGASSGKGLGHRFLRHLFRNRILVFLLDAALSDPVGDLAMLEKELEAHDPALRARPRFLLLNKIDLLSPEDREAARGKILEARPGEEVYLLSAATGEGVKEIVAALAGAVSRLPPAPRQEAVLRPHAPALARILRVGQGWRIEDEVLERYIARWPVSHHEDAARFWRLVERRGHARRLVELGAAKGDLVRIGQIEFEYTPE